MATLERDALLIEARQALRKTYVHDLSVTEKIFLDAISKLVHAVEASEPKPPEPPTPEEISLEELYASLAPRGGSSATASNHKFVISFTGVQLSVDEIWPHGDAPENPTPEDVIEVMRGSVEHAHPSTVAASWLLIDSLAVRYHSDANADMEVEWDGS